jgi:hypothetical protein
VLCKDLTSFLYTFFKLKIQNINIDIENRIQSKAKEKSHENQIESNQIEDSAGYATYHDCVGRFRFIF